MNTNTIITIIISSAFTIVISTLSFFFKRLLDEQKKKEDENTLKNTEQDKRLIEQEKKIIELDKLLLNNTTVVTSAKNEVSVLKDRDDFTRQAINLKITDIEKKLELNSQADYLREKAEKEKLMLELDYIKKEATEFNNRFSRIEDRYNKLLEMWQNSRNNYYSTKQP